MNNIYKILILIFFISSIVNVSSLEIVQTTPYPFPSDGYSIKHNISQNDFSLNRFQYIHVRSNGLILYRLDQDDTSNDFCSYYRTFNYFFEFPDLYRTSWQIEVVGDDSDFRNDNPDFIPDSSLFIYNSQHILNFSWDKNTTHTDIVFLYQYPFIIQNIITQRNFEISSVVNSHGSLHNIFKQPPPSSWYNLTTINDKGIFNLWGANLYVGVPVLPPDNIIINLSQNERKGFSLYYIDGGRNYTYINVLVGCDNSSIGNNICPLHYIPGRCYFGITGATITFGFDNTTHHLLNPGKYTFYNTFMKFPYEKEEEYFNISYDEFFKYPSPEFKLVSNDTKIAEGNKYIIVNNTDNDEKINISIIPNTLKNGTWIYYEFPYRNASILSTKISDIYCVWYWSNNRYISEACPYEANISIKRGSLNLTSVTSIALFNYKFTTNTSKEFSVTIFKSELFYKNISMIYQTPTTYSFDKVFGFNCSWIWNTSRINLTTVLFQLDSVNYTITTNRSIDSESAEFYTLFNSLSVKNYTYRWYGINSEGLLNQTDLFTYEIQRDTSSVDIYFNSTKNSDKSYVQGTDWNISCVSNNTQSNVSMYINNILVNRTMSYTENNTITSIGTYNITCYSEVSENYSASSNEKTITVVSAGTPTYSDLKTSYISGASYDFNRSWEFNVTWTWNSSTSNLSVVIFEIDGKNYTISNNRSISSESAEFYKSFVGGFSASTYTYNWYANNTVGNRGDVSQNYTISKATPVNMSLAIYGSSWSFYYPALIKISAEETNIGDGSCEYNLYLDDVLQTNPTNYFTPSVGVYTAKFSTTGCQNYTSYYITQIMTVQAQLANLGGGGGSGNNDKGYCGDSLCTGTETMFSCPKDCAKRVIFLLTPKEVTDVFYKGGIIDRDFYIENQNDFQIEMLVKVNCIEGDPSCKWVEKSGNMTIPPRGTRVIKIKTTIPYDAEEKDYSYTVSFSFGDESQTASCRLQSIVLLTSAIAILNENQMAIAIASIVILISSFAIVYIRKG